MESQILKAKIWIVLVTMSTVSSEVYTDSANRYISQRYFEMHPSLDDLEFNNFIAREMSQAKCKMLQEEIDVVPRLSALTRNLHGEGSHRQLSSSIRLRIQQESLSQLAMCNCEAIIVERLPSGVFADPFELHHLVERSVFRDAVVLGDTNLELPSFRSNRSLVEIHMGINANLLSEQENEMEVDVNIQLPLHARYPSLGEGYARIEFGQPDIFLRCNDEGKALNGTCLFKLTDSTPHSKPAAAVWDVPCGKKEHSEVVSALTFTAAVVSALFIVLASIYYPDSTEQDGLKQS